jgi:hypothetical protein
MRTTVDIDPVVLDRAKALALQERRTLGAVLGDALSAYLGRRRETPQDPPFELIVRGSARARFPSPEDLLAQDDEEDAARLRMPSGKRRVAP